MQKAPRFTCSTGPLSCPSNTTLRTRRSSRTSSARGARSPRAPAEDPPPQTKSKTRQSKWNIRLLSNTRKTSKKPSKPSRTMKPNYGSLQNAVVLAPFHTLKRCFQTKLVDLYSYEKMKKINHKSKMAKKQNMSFEYDIIELKPLGLNVKEEAAVAKKSKQKSRSASYCQCNKTEKKSGRGGRQGRKTSRGELFLGGKGPGYSGQEVKRRKLTPQPPVSFIQKAELVPALDFYAPPDAFPLPHTRTKPTFSALSSVSKSDSWESYSNPLSYQEQHVQGSLAISNTSFDSYLEHFDKGSWDCSESGRKCGGRSSSQKPQKQVDPEFHPKPTADASRHLIMPVEGKNSDGEIMDFMDREPQSQVIPSVESNPHWQPLRRQGKTKEKKQERDSTATYSLRSLSSKEKVGREGSRSEFRSSKGNLMSRSRVFQIEVGTQVEENGLETVPSSGSLDDRRGSVFEAFDVTAQKQPSTDPTPEDVTLRHSDQDVKPHLEKGSTEAEPPAENLLLLPSFEPVEGLFEPQRMNRNAKELVPELHQRLQEPVIPLQPRDKDSEYIFGAREEANRLGESCEFSFGLKWAFSDDDD